MYNKLLSILNKTGRIKDCFRGNNCFGKIVLSHSLQKNGKLSIIESLEGDNMLIYTPTNSIRDSSTGRHIGLEPIGKAKASTFFGFCEAHDKQIFQKIEDEDFDVNSNEKCFLHSYRAYAHSYHIQRQMLKAYEVDSDFTKSLNPEIRNSYIEGYKEGVEEGESDRDRLNKMLNEKRFDELDYFIYRFKRLYPIASSGCVSPLYSIYGIPINNHTNTEVAYSNIMLTVFPERTETIAIFGIFNNDTKGKIILEELKKLSDIQFIQILSTFLTFYSENTFFSPFLWNNMTAQERNQYLKELDFAVSLEFELMPSFKLARTNFFQDKFVLE